MAKQVWHTIMFDVAKERDMSLHEMARRGNNRYSVSYLSHINTGERAVPGSIDFQEWVAQILGKPREELFFT